MKIGFIDNQFTNYHYKKFYGLLTGSLVAEHEGIVGAWELAPSDEGEKWAADNKITYAGSAAEVIQAADALIVLAPNNPEKHLELARPALQSGKPVFIDKMLAQTTADAKQIIELAGKHSTPLMSASSLRFAPELDALDAKIQGKAEDVFARGLGKFPIYAVHTITMALRYFGPKVTRVIDTGVGSVRTVTIDNGTSLGYFELRDSKNQYEATPWQVGVRVGDKYEVVIVKDADGFYENLMRNVLQYFKTGKSPITTEEQLATVAVQEAAEKSVAAGGTWVNVN